MVTRNTISLAIVILTMVLTTGYAQDSAVDCEKFRSTALTAAAKWYPELFSSFTLVEEGTPFPEFHLPNSLHSEFKSYYKGEEIGHGFAAVINTKSPESAVGCGVKGSGEEVLDDLYHFYFDCSDVYKAVETGRVRCDWKRFDSQETCAENAYRFGAPSSGSDELWGYMEWKGEQLLIVGDKSCETTWPWITIVSIDGQRIHARLWLHVKGENVEDYGLDIRETWQEEFDPNVCTFPARCKRPEHIFKRCLHREGCTFTGKHLGPSVETLGNWTRVVKSNGYPPTVARWEVNAEGTPVVWASCLRGPQSGMYWSIERPEECQHVTMPYCNLEPFDLPDDLVWAGFVDDCRFAGPCLVYTTSNELWELTADMTSTEFQLLNKDTGEVWEALDWREIGPPSPEDFNPVPICAEDLNELAQQQ